jgi:hypothetical protein
MTALAEGYIRGSVSDTWKLTVVPEIGDGRPNPMTFLSDWAIDACGPTWEIVWFQLRTTEVVTIA